VKLEAAVVEHQGQLLGVAEEVPKARSCAVQERNEQPEQQLMAVLLMGEGVVWIWKQPAGEEVPELRGLMGEVAGVRTVSSMQAEAEAYPVREVEGVRVEVVPLGPL
jgi:hypothetical protein